MRGAAAKNSTMREAEICDSAAVLWTVHVLARVRYIYGRAVWTSSGIFASQLQVPISFFRIVINTITVYC